MATFILTYRAPENYTLGTPDGVAAWNSWFESLGAHIADMGQPVAESAAVGDCGETRPIGGYSLITADDLVEAVALAKGCPFVGQGGGVEVGQLAEPPGGGDPA
jgi:hypothetical protein